MQAGDAAFEYEIIVVDNLSTDKTTQLVRNYPVKLLFETERQSSYAARNHGIIHAKGSIVSFIDADCMAKDDWLSKLTEIFASEMNILMKVSSADRVGKMRLMQTSLVKPSTPKAVARKISAMPPDPIRSVSTYFPKACGSNFTPCMVWNPFAVSTVEEAERRLQGGRDAVRKACLGSAKTDATWAAEILAFIGRVPKDSIDLGRGIKAPRWYRRMTHINLPDARVGYAVLDINEAGSKLQTFIR